MSDNDQYGDFYAEMATDVLQILHDDLKRTLDSYRIWQRWQTMTLDQQRDCLGSIDR